jgi:Ca2+-transporting ATPase
MIDPALCPLKELAPLLKTDLTCGLSQDEAQNRLEQEGPNLIKESKKTIYRDFFLDQIKDPIILILLLALLLKIFTRGLTDSLAIGCVIIFNTLLGLFQTKKTQNSLAALKSLMSPYATVIREGLKSQIKAQDLVKGDLIYLESGMIIPADARLTSALNLACDESMLSGESVPVEKHEGSIFSGTIITRGRAQAVIYATGDQTKLGSIASSLYNIDESPSPLQLKLKAFSKTLSLTLIILVGLIVGIGYLQGYQLIDLTLLAISLIVSAIPEGLPLAITLCLVIGMQKMAKNKALIKRLSSIETLGSTTVICSDKTGTLTCNQMTVVEFIMGDQHFKPTGSGYNPEGCVEGSGEFSKIALIGALACETTLSQISGSWTCQGDPTEAALIVLSKKLKVPLEGFRANVVIPFESEHQYMASYAYCKQEHYLLIKGAPSKILKFCTTMQTAEGSLTPIDLQLIQKQEYHLSNQGLRTLALAYIPLKEAYSNQPLKEAVFTALVGIQDPLRDNMPQVLNTCQQAGLNIKIITGDHPLTASYIYKQLFGHLPEATLEGSQIDKMNQKEQNELLPPCDLFARVSPQNKLCIIESLKKQNQIVAMVGDGVNDAPSLKSAHIGIAMGSGSDVAKQTASMIIVDDQLSTLVKAIEMGRMIYQTLQNLITYLLITGSSGVLVIYGAVAFKWPLPLLPIQFLWINLVTDGSSTLPLCFESLRPSLMTEKPNKVNQPLLSKSKIFYMATISFFMSSLTLAVFFYHKQDLNYAQTAAFTTLAFLQIWNVQSSRSFQEPNLFSFKYQTRTLKRIPFKNNKPVMAMMVVALSLQLLAVELPFLQPFLHTQSLKLHDWILIGISSFSVIIIADSYKWIRFRYKNLIKQIELKK